MKIIQPAVFERANPLGSIKKLRWVPEKIDVPLAGLRPAAGDGIQITTPFSLSQPAVAYGFPQLNVIVDSNVLIASNTRLALVSQKTKKEVMALNTAPASVTTATEWDAQEEQKALGSTPGLKLKWRIFPEGLILVLVFDTARTTDIAAGKTARVFMSYINHFHAAATEPASV